MSVKVKATLCWFAGMVTDAGTVPAPAGLRLIATTMPPAGAGRSSDARSWMLPVGATFAVGGDSVTVVGTSSRAEHAHGRGLRDRAERRGHRHRSGSASWR